MGQTLSYPATGKTSESGGNHRFLYSVSEMQGWRITMEDAHATILDLDEGKQETNTFFAVYDGHGGSTVAKFAGQNVHKRLVTAQAYHQKQYEGALKRAFLDTDEDLRADPKLSRDISGCTAIAALVTHENEIYVANAGDSRSIVCVNGAAVPLSFDHKPTNQVEKERIENAGGYVEFGRVNGNLAPSRALGDFEFKKNNKKIPEEQVITANPDVLVHEITQDDEFLVLACDGIWDCLSSQEVADFVRLHISQSKELAEIGEMMCDHCLAPDTSSRAGIGCDNMTVMIVAILNGRTKEEWYTWVTDRVNRGIGRQTPTELPEIYPPSKVKSFKMRREAEEAGKTLNEQERGEADYDFGASPLKAVVDEDDLPSNSLRRYLENFNSQPYNFFDTNLNDSEQGSTPDDDLDIGFRLQVDDSEETYFIYSRPPLSSPDPTESPADSPPDTPPQIPLPNGDAKAGSNSPKPQQDEASSSVVEAEGKPRAPPNPLDTIV